MKYFRYMVNNRFLNILHMLFHNIDLIRCSDFYFIYTYFQIFLTWHILINILLINSVVEQFPIFPFNSSATNCKYIKNISAGLIISGLKNIKIRNLGVYISFNDKFLVSHSNSMFWLFLSTVMDIIYLLVFAMKLKKKHFCRHFCRYFTHTFPPFFVFCGISCLFHTQSPSSYSFNHWIAQVLWKSSPSSSWNHSCFPYSPRLPYLFHLLNVFPPCQLFFFYRLQYWFCSQLCFHILVLDSVLTCNSLNHHVP